MTFAPSTPFPTVFLREGYERKDVDSFLASLASMPPAARLSAIEDVRFTPVRLRTGYDMGEVDRYLDDLSVSLEAQANR